MVSSDLETPVKTVSLKTGEEIIGLYKKLQTDAFSTNLVLELPNCIKIQISCAKGSTEARIIHDSLCRVKHNVKLGILKLEDPTTPIRIQKFPNLRTKQLTIYLNVSDWERIEPYQEPSKKISTAVTRLLDIIENKQTIVAVIIKTQVQCNKMQGIGKPDKFYCSNLGATTNKQFCLEKCAVATEYKKIRRQEVTNNVSN